MASSSTQLPTLALRTPDAWMLLSKLQERQLVRALIAMTADQFQRCQDPSIGVSHQNARRKSGQALQELIAFLVGAGVHMPRDAQQALTLDFEIKAPSADVADNGGTDG